MKAPDKLYIGRRNYGPLIGGWESQPFTFKEIESIEYVRKDALLEWANAQKDALFASEITDVAAGLNAAYDLLISKLERL